jgi:hypothetical protein
MHARIDDHFLDSDIRFRKGRVGLGLVAGLPVEDVIVMLARTVGALLLVLDIFADHRSIGRHGFERIDIARQCLVFDFDQVGGIRRGVPVLRDNKSYLLVLEQDLAIGQHHLHVAGKRRHPGEIDGLERFRGDHRNHARNRCRLGRVDLLDTGVGMRRAGEIAVQHAGQLEVVDVIALALNESNVLNALALAAHALKLFGAFGGGGGCVVHSAASWNGTPFILAAAY